MKTSLPLLEWGALESGHFELFCLIGLGSVCSVICLSNDLFRPKKHQVSFDKQIILQGQAY